MLFQGVEGTGLAFIVFTEAITKMPGSPVWSVLFFIMLFCLGVSSLFGNIEGVVVPLKDLKLLPQKWPQEALTGLTCFIAFIISLLFAQHSGLYWVTLFDNFAGSVPLLTIGLFEMIAVAYIYGMDRFNEDVEFMIGYKPSFFWQASLRFTSPLIVVVILAFYLVTLGQEELTYLVWDPESEKFPALASVPYPSWINAAIFLLAGVPSLVMPGYALCRLVYVSCKNRIQGNN
nr:sodium-dependent neutral amino acid transporter B(0)AT1-like [Labrus bergylta]